MISLPASDPESFKRQESAFIVLNPPALAAGFRFSLPALPGREQ